MNMDRHPAEANAEIDPADPRCPRCGAQPWRDEVDVGVGFMYGPWGCPCGWAEHERYDVTAGPKFEGTHQVDQWGGLTPAVVREPFPDDER